MSMLITSLADRAGVRLLALVLTVCLVHCGPGKPPSDTAGGATTENSSGPEETTSAATSSATGENSSGPGLPDLGDSAGDTGCLVEVWSWVHDQDGWHGEEGGLALAGSRFQAVGSLGGSSVTLAVTADGSLAWGPNPLAGANSEAWFGSGLVGLASGDALTITSGISGAWLERWSAAGDSAAAMAIPGDGYRLGPAALTPDGGIVAGGFVGPSPLDGEAVLMSLSVDGVPAWDIRLDHSHVGAVAVDPSATIFVLAVDRYIEGGVVYLEALDPAGIGKWSVQAGSNTGFIMMGALTPFAVTPDGQGGVYTLGQQHTLKMGDTPAADAMLLTRYHPDGELAWEVRPAAPGVIDGGGLAVVADGAVFSAADWGDGTSLMVHRHDGALVCARSVPDRNVRAVVASSHDEVVLMGNGRIGRPAWFARYRVVLD